MKAHGLYKGLRGGGAPTADVHSWAKADLSDSCKNPWMFAKLMAICLIIPDNYLLKSHASAYQQSNKWIKAYEKRIVTPALKSFFGFII